MNTITPLPKNISKLTTISATNLHKVRVAVDAQYDGALSATIEAGYGHVLNTEMQALADKGCPVALRYVTLSAAFSNIIDEERARRAFSGTLNPIPQNK